MTYKILHPINIPSQLISGNVELLSEQLSNYGVHSWYYDCTNDILVVECEGCIDLSWLGGEVISA